jgi:hypothetical protein
MKSKMPWSLVKIHLAEKLIFRMFRNKINVSGWSLKCSDKVRKSRILTEFNFTSY